MITSRRLIAGAALVGALVMSGAVRAQEIAGTYLSQSGETRVRMSPCGAAFCGVIVWVSKPGNDVNNPDEAKRSRPLVGIPMIYGMKSTGDGTYAGKLYNYTNGKTYTGKLKVSGSELELSGCVLGGLLCQSQTWKKVN
ncbi:Uncharacterized conserved protein, DUF2147 family [Rhizobiales bacterium GAS188]|nr:Uncharacterized conserved protein, DUF2147 family [Rhizobiales bacterium GAS188]